MNSEHLQQLYGGEISNFVKIQNKTAPDYINQNNNSDQLSNVYNAQVKPKGSINATNSILAFNPKHLIDQPTEDPLIVSLRETLNKVATEIGLTDADGIRHSPEYNPMLRDQSSDDLNQANDAVLKALEELKTLGEI